MQGRNLFPNHFLGLRNPFNQFNSLLTRRRNHAPTQSLAQRVHPPPGPTLDAMEFRRTLRLEESFQLTTYSNLGHLKNSSPTNSQSPQYIPSISLSDIQDIIKKVEKTAAHLMNEFQKGMDDLDYKDLLKRLILKRLTGRDDVKGDLFQLDWKKTGFSLDFELDYQGLLKTKGEVSYSELHFELHLDFEETITRVHTSYPPDQGLRRIAPNIIDTGRYLIGFLNATSLKIFDKKTSLSTTIWGDPHVDLSDVPGRLNGEFSDLQKSSIKTTFKLLDSTTVVVTAPDNGLIEGVDIFKGKDHVKGYGLDLNFPDPMDPKAMERFLRHAPGSFDPVEHDTPWNQGALEDSDVVIAGGDGNDWYDETGRLVWGDG